MNFFRYINTFKVPHLWCNGWHAHLQCGRWCVSFGWVKPNTLEFLFFEKKKRKSTDMCCSSTKRAVISRKSKNLLDSEFRMICPSGATCLPANC